MTSFNAKLFASAIGVTLLASPSFAQSPNYNGAGGNNGYSSRVATDPYAGAGLYNSGAYAARVATDPYAGAGLYDSGANVGTGLYDTVSGYNGAGSYPNPMADGGSLNTRISGGTFNLDRGYPITFIGE
jgi:hypothetical protein